MMSAARDKTELQPVIARHDDVLRDRKVLPLAYHMLGAKSLEQALFDGYLDQISKRHPGAPLPALHQSEGILADAERLRAREGDEQFFAELNGGAAGAGGRPVGGVPGQRHVDRGVVCGREGGRARIGAAAASGVGAGRAVLHRLHAAGGATSTWIPGWRPSPGTPRASAMTRSPCSWTSSCCGWRSRSRTGSSSRGSRRRSPIWSRRGSGAARSRWSRSWPGRWTCAGGSPTPGPAARSRRRWTGRSAIRRAGFPPIVLGDDNLPYVASKRLLRRKPDNPDADAQLRDAFARLDRRPDIWDVLLDGINTDERHRGADEAAFRLTYPFSPALISTLRTLASVMQRERTALKVMQQMLVARRDVLTIDDVIPVGDAFDYIVEGQQALDTAGRGAVQVGRRAVPG